MLQKKITFDSFIRGILSGIVISRNTLFSQSLKRSITSIFRCVAHRLPYLSYGYFLSV